MMLTLNVFRPRESALGIILMYQYGFNLHVVHVRTCCIMYDMHHDRMLKRNQHESTDMHGHPFSSPEKNVNVNVDIGTSASYHYFLQFQSSICALSSSCHPHFCRTRSCIKSSDGSVFSSVSPLWSRLRAARWRQRISMPAWRRSSASWHHHLGRVQ